MSDLIKREDAMQVAFLYPFFSTALVEEIKAIPSADRPQGEWINHFDDLFPEDSTIECSVCHEHQPMGIDENYCPNCGARMKGVDDA